MTRKNLRTAGLLGAAALAAVAALTVFAAGHGHLGGHFGGRFAGGPMGAHGPLAMHFKMMQLIDDLDLTPEQQAHVEAIHQILAERGEERREHHGEHAQRILERLEQGSLSSEEVRPVIDGHIEQFRGVAYAISDELIALVNSLDETQRATLRAHVQEMHGGDAGSAEPEPGAGAVPPGRARMGFHAPLADDRRRYQAGGPGARIPRAPGLRAFGRS
ncbi:MAG: apolipoprotein A1/A4/E family protein [Thermoanaerobaculia bacterium]|nr:apolipoprotein A1/A4/E family protein [Thermoanaerobaculia bacterium]